MKHIFTYTIVALLFFSCAKDQPEVAWLKIDQWDLVANPDAENPQGELSHNLNQVFVNMDGKSLGMYELPAKIPIIGEDRKSTRLNSSHVRISYAVFCLK